MWLSLASFLPQCLYISIFLARCSIILFIASTKNKQKTCHFEVLTQFKIHKSRRTTGYTVLVYLVLVYFSSTGSTWPVGITVTHHALTHLLNNLPVLWNQSHCFLVPCCAGPAEEAMNRVPLQQQQQSCGPWERRERLGTGGFGNVTRWQNKVPHWLHSLLSVCYILVPFTQLWESLKCLCAFFGASWGIFFFK